MNLKELQTYLVDFSEDGTMKENKYPEGCISGDNTPSLFPSLFAKSEEVL